MTINQQINNDDESWEFIFKLINVYKHLKRTALLELACTSKSMCFQLRPILFGTMRVNDKSRDTIANVHKAISTISINEYNNLKLINSIHISYRVVKKDYFTILTYFPNITSLTLISVKFDIDYLNLVFNNLKSLNSLMLKRVRLRIFLSLAVSINNVNLYLPLTLNKLKVYSCTFYVYNNLNVLQADNLLASLKLCPYNSISKLKFKNLERLTFIDTNKFSVHFLNNFLTNNPDLKALSVEFFEFNKWTFGLLQNLKYLAKLNLLRIGETSEIEKYCVKSINSITTISLDQSVYRSKFEICRRMATLMPNLQHLKLIHVHRNLREVEILIRDLKTLKSLVLISKSSERRFQLNLESCSLIKLNFVNFYLNCISLRKLQGLVKLRHLKITSYVGESVNAEELKEEFGEFGWVTRITRRCVICSKI